MGVLGQFYIAFDNQMAVYYPGQVMQGNVVFEVTEPFNVRGVRLLLHGYAYLHWSEGSDKNRRHYSARENYFKHEILIGGNWSGDTGEQKEVGIGTHSYPFQFQVPSGLPSSFEGDIGYVRYYAKAIIDRKWRIDPTTKRAFTIITMLDLNGITGVMNGTQGEKEKFICCCCCRSGPLSASFSLPRIGYVPGDSIPLYAQIENFSNRRICKSYIEIKQLVHYHATTKTRTIGRQVAVVSRPEIRPGKSDQWNGEVIQIPPVPPSFLQGCNIIDITYVVQLNVDPAGPALDLEVPLGIIVGSIPHQTALQQQFAMMAAPPPAPIEPTAPGMPSGSELYGPYTPGAPMAPPPPTSHIPNLPPPTYSESVFGKTNFSDEGDDGDMQGDKAYAPKYTYYNWN